MTFILIAESPLLRDYAEMWQAANKIVYSRTLATASTRKTQLERTFDPEAIRQLKETTEQDILIGGPELTAHAFRPGLVEIAVVLQDDWAASGVSVEYPVGGEVGFAMTSSPPIYDPID